MKRKTIIVLIVIVLLAIVYASYKLFNFNLFNVEKTSLAKLPIEGQDFIIDISFVQAGATTEDVIQIKKVFDNGKEEIIRNFENYNYLVGYNKLNETAIQLILNDTSYFENKSDTFRIEIP